MRPFAKNKVQWNADLYFAVKVVRHKLYKDYAKVTPTTGLLRITAHMVDPFRKLQSLREWDKAMDTNPEDKTSYTTQYQEAFLKSVENIYSAKHGQMSVIKPENVPHGNIFLSAQVSGLAQSSLDPYDLSSGDEDYSTPEGVAETTPGWCDCTACLLMAAGPYFDSPPETPKHWGQINPNINDYHSDPMEISCTSRILDITDWWR